MEVSHLLKEIEKTVGEPIEPTILLIPSMSNIISSLAFGKRFEYSDPDRIMLDELIMVSHWPHYRIRSRDDSNGLSVISSGLLVFQEIPRRAGQVAYVHFMPWVKKILLWLKWGSCNKLREALIRREAFCE